jgi:DNA polymerase-3 subunit delta
VIDTDPGRNSRARNEWFEAQLQASGVHLEAAARRRIFEHIGEDASRLAPILELAEATYGEGRKLSADQIEPLLGEEGSAPPWELTDAIDAGDGERAIRVLSRLLGAGERHPLQVLATLNRHVSGLLRLDGADVRSAEEAAGLLSMSAFPARKLLEQSRRLGHDRIVRAVEVVAEADADLRGRLGWPAELVIEVAVARLAQLSRSNARPAPRPAGRR